MDYLKWMVFWNVVFKIDVIKLLLVDVGRIFDVFFKVLKYDIFCDCIVCGWKVVVFLKVVVLVVFF